MLELVKYIATSLVDKPEAIDVREVENEENIVIELRVDPDDMGKVIGKQGRIAAGSGTTVQEVNLLLKQFDQAKSMMKNVMGGMKGGKMKRMMNRFGKQ